MNSDETNLLNMTRTTNQFCTDHAADTAAITDYAPLVLQSKNKVILIDALDQIAQGKTTGVTTNTNQLRLIMEMLTLVLANGLISLAGKLKDAAMKAAADYSLSDFAKMEKDQVDDVCKDIHDLAFTNALALVPRGVTPIDITDAATAISVYRTAMQDPRKKRIELKEANRKIPIMIREIVGDIYEAQLDPMTETLRTKKPDYWNGYFAAREKIDLGTGTTRIKGDVINQATVPAEPVYNATVTLIPQDATLPTLTLKTGIDGLFNTKAKHGNYTGKVEHPDLGTATIKPFLLKQGKTVELHVVMGQLAQ